MKQRAADLMLYGAITESDIEVTKYALSLGADPTKPFSFDANSAIERYSARNISARLENVSLTGYAVDFATDSMDGVEILKLMLDAGGSPNLAPGVELSNIKDGGRWKLYPLRRVDHTRGKHFKEVTHLLIDYGARFSDCEEADGGIFGQIVNNKTSFIQYKLDRVLGLMDVLIERPVAFVAAMQCQDNKKFTDFYSLLKLMGNINRSDQKDQFSNEMSRIGDMIAELIEIGLDLEIKADNGRTARTYLGANFPDFLRLRVARSIDTDMPDPVKSRRPKL